MSQIHRIGVLFLLLSGCAGALKYDLRGSEVSPGSDARVVAKVDTGRNLTALELQASNLAPADRVLEGGMAYVIWARKDSSVAWSRVGALELSDEGRTGAAQVSVPEVAFDLLVSVEANAASASPSGKTVFHQRVEDK
jgi:hypothetical protein